jgi:hypothetical protein
VRNIGKYILSVFLLLQSLNSLSILASDNACDQLVSNFYSKTNWKKTDSFKKDVLAWLISDEFKNYINTLDSSNSLVVPIKNTGTFHFNKFISDKLSNKIFDFYDSDFYNLGYANFIAFQLMSLNEKQAWNNCKQKLERGLNVFVYDTIFEVFKIHLSYLPYDGRISIKIKPPYIENGIIDTLSLINNNELYEFQSYGGRELFCKISDIHKPLIISINSVEGMYGRFIYLPGIEDTSDKDSLNVFKYLLLSNWIKKENDLDYDGKYKDLLNSNNTKYSAIRSRWNAEQRDASIIADYFFEKYSINKTIANIINNKIDNTASLRNLYLQIIKIENDFIRQTYPINFTSHLKYPWKVISY